MSFTEAILKLSLSYRLISSLVDRAKLRAIRRLKGDFSGLRVLDLGCGVGNSARLFRNSRYTGIDINPGYVKFAARRYPGLKFVNGDVSRMDWGSGFDVVLVNSLLHHLDDRQAEKILGRSTRALNPGGRVILQEPLVPGEEEWRLRMIMKLDRGDYFRTIDEWKQLSERSGLFPEIVSFYHMRVLGIMVYKMVSISLSPKLAGRRSGRQDHGPG